MAQIKRKDEKIQRLNMKIGGAGIGGLIVLGGVVVGAALLEMLKRRNDGKRNSGRGFSGQGSPEEKGKVVAVESQIYEESRPEKSLRNGDDIDENGVGDEMREFLSKNKETTDDEVEISLESRQNYPRELELAEKGKEITDNEVEISLESRKNHQRELGHGEKNLIEENLTDQCKENEELTEENDEEAKKKEMKDCDLPAENENERVVDDVVDECLIEITQESMQDECFTEKMQVDDCKFDLVFEDLNSLVLEDAAIEDEEEVAELGEDSNSLVLEKPSIQAEENVAELEEHISASLQDLMHLHHLREEEIKYTEEVAELGEDLKILVLEKPSIQAEEIVAELEEHISTSLLDLKHLHHLQEEEIEYKLSADVKNGCPDPLIRSTQDKEKLGGEVLQGTFKEQNSDESSSKLKCSLFKLSTEIEEDKISGQEVHPSSETLHLISETVEEENQILNWQHSLYLDHSKGERDEQCSIETKVSPTDTEASIAPLNSVQFNESEQYGDDLSKKAGEENEINFQHDQEQEQNAGNEQQEARNANLNGDKQIQIEATKIAYEVYENKDKRFLNLAMDKNKSISMVRSVLVALLLIFLYHIFAKF